MPFEILFPDADSLLLIGLEEVGLEEVLLSHGVKL